MQSLMHDAESKQTRALVVSSSRTVSPPHGDLGRELHLCDLGVTPLCYFVAILHSSSQSLILAFVALRCGSQLLVVTFSFLSARCIRWPGFVPIRVSCRCVIDVVWLGLVCCKRLIRTLITVCSASVHLLLLEIDILGQRVYRTRAAAAQIEVSMSRTSQFARSFLMAQVRLWNDLPYTVFHTGTLDRFKGAVNSWLFSSYFSGAGACEISKAINKKLRFSHLCCWF